MTNLRKAIDAMGNEAALAQAVNDSMPPFGTQTPVQEEVTPEIGHGHLVFALGIVRACKDSERAGRITVDAPCFEGPQDCDYVSPIAGAGYGFFAVPGIGATVLIGKTPFTDPPNQNFWFGCMYAAGQREIPGVQSQPYSLEHGPLHLVKNEVMDNGEPIPNDPTVSYGVPNESDIYRDDNLPGSFVLKHPAGHSISLTDKRTSDREENEIKLKTAGNKRLIMSDAPAAAGGETILLQDENGNGIRIASQGDDITGVSQDSIATHAGGDITTYSEKGSMSQIISPHSKGDFTIANAGMGNVAITSNNGSLSVSAQTTLTLVCGACSIVMDRDTMTIEAPQLLIKGSTGDVTMQGVTLLDHRHYGKCTGGLVPTTVGRMLTE